MQTRSCYFAIVVAAIGLLAVSSPAVAAQTVIPSGGDGWADYSQSDPSPITSQSVTLPAGTYKIYGRWNDATFSGSNGPVRVYIGTSSGGNQLGDWTYTPSVGTGASKYLGDITIASETVVWFNARGASATNYYFTFTGWAYAASAPPEPIAGPVIDPAASYNGSLPFSVTITPAAGQEGQPIYYKTGSAPVGNEDWLAYSGPISISSYGALAVYAKTGTSSSESSTTLKNFVIHPSPPVPSVSPASGSYSGTQQISASMVDPTSYFELLYQVQGDVQTGWQTYAGGFALPGDITFSVKSRDMTTGAESSVVSRSYVQIPAPAPPTFSPPYGSLLPGDVVTISIGVDADGVWYTLDGSAPGDGVGTYLEGGGGVSLPVGFTRLRAVSVGIGGVSTPTNAGFTRAAAEGEPLPDADGDGVPDAFEQIWPDLFEQGRDDSETDSDASGVPDYWQAQYFLYCRNGVSRSASTLQTITDQFYMNAGLGATLPSGAIMLSSSASGTREEWDKDGNGEMDGCGTTGGGTPSTGHCCNCCCSQCQANPADTWGPPISEDSPADADGDGCPDYKDPAPDDASVKCDSDPNETIKQDVENYLKFGSTGVTAELPKNGYLWNVSIPFPGIGSRSFGLTSLPNVNTPMGYALDSIRIPCRALAIVLSGVFFTYKCFTALRQW